MIRIADSFQVVTRSPDCGLSGEEHKVHHAEFGTTTTADGLTGFSEPIGIVSFYSVSARQPPIWLVCVEQYLLSTIDFFIVFQCTLPHLMQ